MPSDQHIHPESSRPTLPAEYGIQGVDEGKGLLPWSWATDRLARSRGYWLASMQPNGAPHMVVIWGVWQDDRFYFATSANSRKAHNLEANPRCVVCPENTEEAVIVEGAAARVTSPAMVERFVKAYAAKYHEETDTNQFFVYSIRPQVVFATIADALEYPTTATRWRFPGS